MIRDTGGWGFTDRPAVTVGNAVGRGLIGGTGAKAAILQAIDDGSFIPSWNGDASCFAEITRITVTEAALLQSYPRFIIKGEGIGMKAVDLFSGTGWGVACQWLGIEEIGVDNMPEVRATREANGMVNWVDDVWKVLEDDHDDNPALTAELSIASPPCQTFSMAGSGSGRKALDQVYEAIRLRAYRDPARLRELGEQTDPRTALVLTPMCYAYLFRPKFIVWEQVPQVLPVWEACAELLRKGGYSVVTGVLHAEQYGVPQTRKRAILIARSDGIEAKMPTPTHSRYYSRNPKRLDEGVLPWVSMAEALGWGMTARPYLTVAGGGPNSEHGGRHTGAQDTAMLGHKVNADDERRLGEDAARERYGDRAGTQSTRVTVDEAAALQSYPEGFVWCGTKTKQLLQIGNAVPPLLAHAILKELLS